MAAVKAAFIHAFAKQGPKWGLASQLHATERKKGESMCDFIYRLKHLNSRCQPHERLHNDQLLDRFINGMNHKELYNSMITRRITTWEDTIITVIQLEDNLKMRESVNPSSDTSTKKSTTKSAAPPINQVVATYLQKMGYANRNKPRRDLARELVFYLICHADHPMSECPTLRPLYIPQGYKSN